MDDIGNGCSTIRRSPAFEPLPAAGCSSSTTANPAKSPPSSLERFRHPGYCFRSNAQRHYLRTHLREHEVSGLVVDAWLGHGRFGEEAYGRYSCLSPLDVRDAIAGPLTDLLDELGWAAIGGLAR